MELIKLTAGKIDDVPDEREWHAPGSHNEFTACGLACTPGGTDRTAERKRGKLLDVTCEVCLQVVSFYKALR